MVNFSKMFFKIFLFFGFVLFYTNASPPLQIDPVAYTLWDRPDIQFDENQNTDFKLPETVLPTYYRLFLRPILEDGDEQFNAPGEVNITISCKTPTSAIILNSQNIVIDFESTLVVKEGTNDELLITSQAYDLPTLTFHINLGRELERNVNYYIFLKFNTTVADASNGLYRSHYINPDTGDQVWLATTQFQRSGARKAFPCFDEPGIKSVFEISLGHHERHHALCNMDIQSQEPIFGHENWMWTHFNPTPKMPTYLLAMIVSNFTSIEAESGLYRKPLNGYGAKHHIDNRGADFAVHEGARIMTHFEEIYELEYPLPKVDNAAIPQFAAGAMENWGLITYREPDMLYFNGSTTEAIRKRILLVVAHEIAHFWFGDIVTCKEWLDIWLNEGFATYVSAVGVQFSQPEFQGMNFLITDSIQTSLAFDASPSSVPVSYDGNNPSRIIYDKGAAIIRMMVAFLSEPTFMRGINKYLAENAYGNVVQDQLFAYLTEPGWADGNIPENVTMKDIMDTWTLQAGFPLVRVGRATDTRIVVSQEKFGLNFENEKNLNPNENWWIPVSIVSEDNPIFGPGNYMPKFWIPKSTILTTFNISTDQWIIVNPDVRNFYRVLYDKHFYSLIKQQLDRDSKVFSIGTRSQLIDDYFTFAYNKYERIERALELTTFLDKENELFIWIPTFKHLLKSLNYFSGDHHREYLQAYLQPKIEAALKLIGVEQLPGAKGTDVILRVQLLDWACYFKSQLCLDYTTDLHGKWTIPTENPVPFDIQPVIYCAIASNIPNGPEFALEQYTLNLNNDVQRGYWRNALGCVPTSEDGLLRVIDALMSDEGIILPNDANIIFQQLIKNSDTREFAFFFIRENLQAVIAKYTTSTILAVGATLAEYYSTDWHLESYQTFIEANEDTLESIYQQLRTHLIVMQTNILWMTDFGYAMSNWFEAALTTEK